MGNVETRPITVARWGDLVSVFGRRGDAPGWCWCRLFLTPNAARPMNASPNNREALYHEIEHSVTPPGLLAYVDDQPVGWTRVGPRDGLPGVYENRRLAQVLGQNDGNVWWVTCFGRG